MINVVTLFQTAVITACLNGKAQCEYARKIEDKVTKCVQKTIDQYCEPQYKKAKEEHPEQMAVCTYGGDITNENYNLCIKQVMK